MGQSQKTPDLAPTATAPAAEEEKSWLDQLLDQSLFGNAAVQDQLGAPADDPEEAPGFLEQLGIPGGGEILDQFEEDADALWDGGSAFADGMVSEWERRAALGKLKMPEVVDPEKIAERVDKMTVGLDTMEPVAALEAMRGMNEAEAEAFRKALYERQTGDLDWYDADEFEEELEGQLAQRLQPGDYVEALAHLDGDPAEAAVVATQNILRDGDFLDRAEELRDDKLDAFTEFNEDFGTVMKYAPVIPTNLLNYATAADDRFNVDEDRLLSVVEDLPPADRLEYFQDPEIADKLADDLADAMANEGTLSQKWDLLSDVSGVEEASEALEEDLGDMRFLLNDTMWNAALEEKLGKDEAGKLAAIQLEQMLHGTGLDEGALELAEDAVGFDLNTDTEGLEALLDQLGDDPELYAATCKAFTRGLDPELVGDDPQAYVRGLIEDEARLRDADWTDATGLLGVGVRALREDDEDAHRAGEMGGKLDLAGTRDDLAAARKALPEHVTDEDLERWDKQMAKDPEALAHYLQTQGMDGAYRAYREAKAEVELAELDVRAHAIVEAAQSGHTGGEEGLFALLRDPKLTEADNKLREARASHQSPEAIAALEAELTELQATQGERTKALDEAISRATSAEGLEHYGSISEMIDDTLVRNEHVQDASDALASGGALLDEAKYARLLAEHGDLSVSDWVFVSTKGAGTDDPMLREILKNRSQAEMKQASIEFKEDYGHHEWIDDWIVNPFGDYSLAEVEGEDAISHVLGTEASGAVGAELQAEVLGDPRLLFDPKDDALTGEDRAAAAEARLDAELAALGLRSETAESGALDWMANTLNPDGTTAFHHNEAQREALDAFLEEKGDLLRTGDPEAWAELEVRTGTKEHANQTAEGSKEGITAKAKMELAKGAAMLMPMGAGASAGVKILLAMGVAGTQTGMEWALMGDSMTDESLAKGLAETALAGVGTAVDHPLVSAAFDAALEAGFDEAALREGRGMDVFLNAMTKGLAKEYASEGVKSELQPFAFTENRAALTDVAASLASGGVGLLPQILDGKVATADLTLLAQGAMNSAVGGSIGRDARFRGTPAAVATALQEYGPQNPLGATDEQIVQLQVLGVDEAELARRGVSPEQIERVREKNRAHEDAGRVLRSQAWATGKDHSLLTEAEREAITNKALAEGKDPLKAMDDAVDAMDGPSTSTALSTAELSLVQADARARGVDFATALADYQHIQKKQAQFDLGAKNKQYWLDKVAAGEIDPTLLPPEWTK